MRVDKRKILIFVVISLVLLVCAGYYFLYLKPDSALRGDTGDGKVDIAKKLDNRNGIYTYTYIPDEFLKVSSACTVTKLDYYMVVINKKWYSYKGSCMGTYQLGEGSIEDLDIKYNSERDEYAFNYDGNRYVKNKNILSVAPKETFIDSQQNVALDGYRLLAKETMFKDHYYVFKRYISDVGGEMIFGKDKEYQPYSLTIGNVDEEKQALMYTYSSHNIDDFPDFIAFNKKLAIREKYDLNGRRNYTLKLYEFGQGVVYDLNNVFPITVNGVQLSNRDQYIYLDNNANRHYYVMLIGYNPKFCVEGSESDNIAYYEFKVEFDYNNYSFKTPSFVRAWYEKEGCSHINKIMEG